MRLPALARARAGAVLALTVAVGCAHSTPADPAGSVAAARGGPAGAEEGRGTTGEESAGAEGPTTNAGTPVVSPLLVCATDADCTLVPGVCGGVAPVNLTHEAEERRRQEMAAAVASCAAPLARLEPDVARCAAGACIAFVPP